MGLIPGLEKSPGGGHGNLFQYSYMENTTDRGSGRLQSKGLERVGRYCVTKYVSIPKYSQSTRPSMIENCPACILLPLQSIS